jgi:hypothetical protein
MQCSTRSVDSDIVLVFNDDQINKWGKVYPNLE